MAVPSLGRDHRCIRLPPSPPSRPFGPPPWVRRHRRGRGPLRRRSDDRFLGGIAGAVAAATGFEITIVRVGLVIFGLASGVGVAAYVVAWVLVPALDEDRSIASRALADGRALVTVVAFAPPLVVALLLASALRAPWAGGLAWPVFISAAGLVLVWRDGTEVDRSHLRQAVGPLVQIGSSGRGSWRILVGRLVAAAVMSLVGLLALTQSRRGAVVAPLAGVALLLAAIVIVFGPWWLRAGRDLVLERQARLRAEERADLAARVHDSVLQTLALIQRHAADPARVTQLARNQERELRSWLWDGQRPGSFSETGKSGDAGVATVASGITRIQSDVEAAHEVRVEAVVVGDAALTEPLEALLAAGREATVNAAKWSGADVVSIFAEVEQDCVTLYVRDRGRGFDRGEVGSDRRGLAESIEGRMSRAGGSAKVRSEVGAGTEVALRLPLPERRK